MVQRLAPLFGLLAVALPGPALAFDDRVIIAKCDADWGSDFEMVAYCRKQQRAAGGRWDTITARAGTDAITATIVAHCSEDWSGDYEMLAYCHDNQSAAHRSLGQTPADIPARVADTVMARCTSEWGTDYEMVAYCRKNQFEAWRSLQ